MDLLGALLAGPASSCWCCAGRTGWLGPRRGLFRRGRWRPLGGWLGAEELGEGAQGGSCWEEWRAPLGVGHFLCALCACRGRGHIPLVTWELGNFQQCRGNTFTLQTLKQRQRQRSWGDTKEGLGGDAVPCHNGEPLSKSPWE